MIRPKNYSKTPQAGNTIRPNRRKMPRASVGNMKICAVSARARAGKRRAAIAARQASAIGALRANPRLPTRLEGADFSGADFTLPMGSRRNCNGGLCPRIRIANLPAAVIGKAGKSAVPRAQVRRIAVGRKRKMRHAPIKPISLKS